MVKSEIRKGTYFGLVLFFILLLLSCAPNPANYKLPEPQGNSENQPANIQPISKELRSWHSANYRGIEVGKSTEQDMLRILGLPDSTTDVPANSAIKGYIYGQSDGYHYGESERLVVHVEKATGIIAWIYRNPKKLSKVDLIKEYGNDYILPVYGMDPCFIEGRSGEPYVLSFEEAVNTTNSQYVQMEYREAGLSVRFRYEEVYEITFVSDKWPVGTTASMCDQPKKGLSFIACGCGCCGGAKPMKQCIYRSKGDDIKKLVEEDRKWTGSVCATVGCSPGIKYVYCD
jgi:hypothetical protein